ncbi:YegS/Rv2252/BmrU family lipid kinase [Thermobifida halotolerans]|uniref:YegS/Rv2252/BmrU family lipid kinase n=1 Tax=Thermobifida halotolerans TaxID=483545 RepID=A0A399G9K7_9ACTN|nr:YegS/Rv2252/BmrU family lipid kinase [Thermobifida halotolerans]UOE21557.1 YegS/Rv2252/BmrU family lipid kinase [Thermobifida halotolerans]
MPTVALLVNPASGRRGAAVAAAALLERLRARGAEVHVAAGDSASDSARLARELAADRPDALVTVGGDGLAHLAVQAVAGTGVPLGVVGAGTGNDIARELGLPRAPDEAARAVLAGRTVAVDTVAAAGRHYLSVLACGFDSRVNERVNGFRLRLGRLDYVAGVLAELGSFTPLHYTLDVDGRRLAADGMLVAVGNTRCYGGGMRICPEARYDDGLLDVVLVRAVGRARFLRLFPRVFTGSHPGLPEVEMLRGRRVTVTVRGPVGVVAYADGERLAEPPLTCEAVPGSVRVLMARPRR